MIPIKSVFNQTMNQNLNQNMKIYLEINLFFAFQNLLSNIRMICSPAEIIHMLDSTPIV